MFVVVFASETSLVEIENWNMDILDKAQKFKFLSFFSSYIKFT